MASYDDIVRNVGDILMQSDVDKVDADGNCAA